METLIIHAENEKLKVVKAILKALKVDFEKGKAQTGYSPEFEEKMRRADKDKKAGRGRKITVDELEGLWK